MLRKPLFAIAIWLAIVLAMTLPRMLWEIPRGVVASCTGQCGGGRAGSGSAAIALRDGRLVRLSSVDVACDCSCGARAPAWCLKSGSFIEKRRWALDIQTGEGTLRWKGRTPCVALIFLLGVGLFAAAFGNMPPLGSLLHRHPWAGWLSPESRRLMVVLAHAPLLTVWAMVVAGVSHPIAYAAVGLVWALSCALLAWATERTGWPRLTLVMARRVARRHGGRVLRGRLEGGWLVTPAGETFAVDAGGITWLGPPPGAGAGVELVGGVETTLEGLLRPIVAVHTLGPLGGRPLIGRVV